MTLQTHEALPPRIARAEHIPDPTTRPDLSWHKWIGSAQDPNKPWLSQHILCTLMDNPNDHPMQFDTTNVTLENRFVTCKECLELIHS